MEKDSQPSWPETIRQGAKKYFIRPLLSSLSSSRRILLAAAVIGEIACSNPNRMVSDQELRNFCEQVYYPSSPTLRPYVGSHNVREPNPSILNDRVATNLMLLDESDNAHWLTYNPEVEDYYPLFSPNDKYLDTAS
jgi:hypothetical protein